MSKNFKVGDLVVGQNFEDFPCRNGMEAVVTEVGPIPTFLLSTGEESIADYQVRWADGRISCCKWFRLRKRPDDQPFTTWAKDHLIPYADCAPSLEETMKRVQRRMADFTRYTQEGSCGS